MSRTLCVLSSLLLLAIPRFAGSDSRSDRAAYLRAHQGDFLVRLAPGLGAGEARDLLAQADAQLASGADGGGWFRALSSDREHGLARLRANPRLGPVEPNHVVEIAADVDPEARTWTPGDPYFPRQWNLAGAPAAWFETRGSSLVVVAVLDTGFRGGLGDSPLYLLPGWDFVNEDPDPDDDNGHGTHIGGLIAQATDNRSRAAGIAPEVALLPVKVLDAGGRGTLNELTRGIYWATDAGARVINMSLSLPPQVRWSQALHDAVAYAAARGVVLVGAAGNHGASQVSLPAAFNEVIAVGALDSAGHPTGYSNRGEALDLAAPGGDAVDRDLDGHPDGVAATSLDPEQGRSGLYLGAGTSQAAAHVSGAAALLLSLGERDRERIRSILELTTRDIPGPEESPSGWDPTSGYGALDLGRAVRERASVRHRPEASLDGWTRPSSRPSDPLDLRGVMAVVVRYRGEWLLLLEERGHRYAVTGSTGSTLDLYKLAAPSLSSLLRASGGLLALLDAAGSVTAWLDGLGRYRGSFEARGGFLGIVEGSGSLLGLLDAQGDTLLLIDSRGALAAILKANGGFLGILDSSGGLLAILEGAGGLLAILESSGGMLALLDQAGGLLGLLEDQAVYPTANGLLPAD